MSLTSENFSPALQKFLREHPLKCVNNHPKTNLFVAKPLFVLRYGFDISDMSGGTNQYETVIGMGDKIEDAPQRLLNLLESSIETLKKSGFEGSIIVHPILAEIFNLTIED